MPRLNKTPFAKVSQPKAKANEIYIYDEIGYFGISAEQFVKDLHAIEAENIDIRINSPGGNVFEGMAIYQAMKEHSAKITVHVDGIAASIASIIALGGDEIVISEGGFFMIHEAWSIVIGTASDMRKEADVLDKLLGSLVNIYAKQTGIDPDEVKTMMINETWLNAEESVDYGFADSIAQDSVKPSAKYNLDIYNNVPPQLLSSNEVKPKDLEKALRDAGLSRQEAKAFVAVGKKALNQRDVGEEELLKNMDSLIQSLTNAKDEIQCHN